jgi:hypothetical protein
MSLSKNVFVHILCCLVLGFSLPAQQDKQVPKCLKLEDVIKLLKNKDVVPKSIVKDVAKYKADFKLDTKTTSKLVREGASDELLKAIEENPCSDLTNLTILFPTTGMECGRAVKVEGVAQKIPGKYLWVFAHAKFLINQWWPQVAVAHVNDTGKWVGRAYLGEKADIGYNFEIVARWVTPEIHGKLTAYISRGSQTGHYPPIELPKGSPSAKVIVKKTAH